MFQLSKLGQRICILGPSGAGKTTFACRLAEKLNTEFISMDRVVHAPGWNPRPVEEWMPIHDTLIDQDSWVMEGAYRKSLPQRLKRAETVFFLDLSILGCQYRVAKRLLTNYGKVRPNAPEGCEERFSLGWLHMVFIHSMKGWKKRRGRYLDILADNPHLHVVHVKSWREFMKLQKQLGL